jgi:formylglycine-generating enzyme required for sulfatase activity
VNGDRRLLEVALEAGPVRIELVRVAPGEFTMGSPEEEPGHAENESPARRVRISRPFALGRFPVTSAQYGMVMASEPDGDALPVSQITFAEALEFCRRLSAAAGADVGLPTEAQWEYACRAGTDTPYWSGSGEEDLARVGWYSANAGDGAQPVGLKPANPWGLHDVHGNVWEYCADFVDDYAAMAEVDPIGRVTGARGAMRGGGWMHDAADCRSARRLISDDMFGGAGFRVALPAIR